MDDIRCGEPGCFNAVSLENIVEMANLAGGSMTGLFPDSHTYRCADGHRKTLREDVANFIASLHHRPED